MEGVGPARPIAEHVRRSIEPCWEVRSYRLGQAKQLEWNGTERNRMKIRVEDATPRSEAEKGKWRERKEREEGGKGWT